MLKTRFLSYFGHFYINKIKPADIVQFYDLFSSDTKLVRKKGNIRSKTILGHHRLLCVMLHKAVYCQMIVSNPAERVQPPKANLQKIRSITFVLMSFLIILLII